MYSIRFKFVTITIVAIIVSILTLGVMGVYTVSAESDQNSIHEMNLLSDDEKRSLDSYLSSLEQSVEMVANITTDMLNSSSAVDVAPSDKRTPEQLKQVDVFLKQQREEALNAFSSVANHTNGIVTYYYCINPEVGTPEDGFFYSKLGKRSFEEQPELDATTLDPNDIEHYTWYFTPIERGEACWLGPYKAHFLNEVWTVSYVTPIYQGDTLLGVLGMDILFDTLVDHIRTVEIYDSGFVSLLDNEGHILYHPKYAIGDMPDQINQLLSTELFQDRNSEGTLIRYTAEGEERQLAFSTLVNGMKLVVVAPVSEITASQRHLTQIIVFVAILLLSFFTVFTLITSRAIIRPLEQLTAASQRLADGDYEVKLDYEGKDEVGMLTDSFRKMRDRLKLHIGDLNSLANTDALTGIKNKNVFDRDADELNEVIGSAEAGETPKFAIVMADCNRLKTINDEYGHDRGDIYLQTASNAICKTFAHSPVYRIGGDEFAALLEGEDYEKRDELMHSFARLTEEINTRATNPWETVDVSVGMAVFDPSVDSTVEQVLRKADELMYLEKRLYKLSRNQAQ